MKITDLFRSAFKAAKEEGVALEGVPAGATDDEVLAGLLSAPSAEVEALKRQVAEMQAQQRRQAAALWADAQVRGRRALPAEREALVALHLQAAEDDAALPRAGQARVAQLEAAYAARPAHVLTQEIVGDAALVALAANAAAADPAAEKRRLLRMTAVGRTALKMQEG